MGSWSDSLLYYTQVIYNLHYFQIDINLVSQESSAKMGYTLQHLGGSTPRPRPPAAFMMTRLTFVNLAV